MHTVALIALLAGGLQTSSLEENSGLTITHDDPTGTVTMTWDGRSGKTYFIQFSDTLKEWTYAPDIEVGQGHPVTWHASLGSGDRMFFRLKYIDTPADLSDPSDIDDDDSDGDGVSNRDELTNGTDPLETRDADADGLPDDWETHYGVGDASEDEEPDGLTNLSEFQQTTDPQKRDHPVVELRLFR